MGLGQLPGSLKCHTLPLSHVPASRRAFASSVSFDLPSSAVGHSRDAIISHPQKKLTGAQEIPRQASISVTPKTGPRASVPWLMHKHHLRMYEKSESHFSSVGWAWASAFGLVHRCALCCQFGITQLRNPYLLVLSLKDLSKISNDELAL